MELKHIELARLSVSGLNMRGTRKACDIANILPSVRARGVLVPLIVRELVGAAGGLAVKVRAAIILPPMKSLPESAAIMPRSPSPRKAVVSRICPVQCSNPATTRQRSKPR